MLLRSATGEFPMSEEHIPVESHQVPEQDRLAFLPSLFGYKCNYVETLVYRWMQKLSPVQLPEFRMHSLDFQDMHYSGGEWDFYALSNGGFFMAPTDRDSYRITVTGNYFDNELSAKASGIVATLFALCELTHTNHPLTEKCLDLYWLLRDYADQEPEGNLIRAAID